MQVHDCEICGEMCGCDQDDTHLPQPMDCNHVCDEDEDLEPMDYCA